MDEDYGENNQDTEDNMETGKFNLGSHVEGQFPEDGDSAGPDNDATIPDKQEMTFGNRQITNDDRSPN